MVLKSLLLGLLLVLAPLGALAQDEIADIDYEYLALRGIGFDFGTVWPDRVLETQAFRLRLDFGYAGPGLRIVPSVSYWSSRLADGEIATLEQRVSTLVADQTGGAPPALDLGVIDYTDIALGLDGHVVWELPLDLLTYGGLGVAAHFVDADGDAIADTFIEDLFDGVEVGFNVHLGTEYPITEVLRLYGSGRYEIMSDLQLLQVRVGLQFMIGPNAPGEGRGND